MEFAADRQDHPVARPRDNRALACLNLDGTTFVEGAAGFAQP